MLEMYLWLGNKYEQEFVEMDMGKVIVDNKIYSEGFDKACVKNNR